VWVSVFLTIVVGTAGYSVTIKIEDLVRGYTSASGAAKTGFMYNGPFPVAIPVSGQIKVEVIIGGFTGGTTFSFTAEAYIDGYTGP
jgi:hypothetical protein